MTIEATSRLNSNIIIDRKEYDSFLLVLSPLKIKKSADKIDRKIDIPAIQAYVLKVPKLLSS